jgi:uncharacterized protein
MGLTSMQTIPFEEVTGEVGIYGVLHLPERGRGDAVVLTHGAGANCGSELLVGISHALAEGGFAVLRFDLPFRRARPHGPPPFGCAARDRDGLRRAVAVMKEKTKGQIFVGGHSYGGRQATMLIAEEPELVDGLLLLSYPLHPPRKPGELRTKHFPGLRTPALFAHGTRDPFGTIAEMKAALECIPARNELFEVKGAGHELFPRGAAGERLGEIAREFGRFARG